MGTGAALCLISQVVAGRCHYWFQSGSFGMSVRLRLSAAAVCVAFNEVTVSNPRLSTMHTNCCKALACCDSLYYHL